MILCNIILVDIINYMISKKKNLISYEKKIYLSQNLKYRFIFLFNILSETCLINIKIKRDLIRIQIKVLSDP